ncbi:uncharacterized protein J3R85_006611, partial [Psidium guajava]
FLLFIFILLVGSTCPSTEAQSCKPSGRIRGRKPPPKRCNPENQSECCKQGVFYRTFKCSPPVSHRTKATLTINSFQKGGDGATGWFDHRSRCLKNITIHGNGRKVNAMVVDECDSTIGCDSDHDFQPPCPNHIVDASKAVWKVLGVPTHVGELDIYWSDD